MGKIMNIDKTYNNKELTLTAEGQVDSITSKELENAIAEELGNFDSMIIDFTDLNYISSAGLRVLISTQKKLQADNIPLVIKNVNDPINEIFRMSGFDKILTIE